MEIGRFQKVTQSEPTPMVDNMSVTSGVQENSKCDPLLELAVSNVSRSVVIVSISRSILKSDGCICNRSVNE